MAHVDLHLRVQLSQLRSPVAWVCQSAVLGLAAVHPSSLLAVVHAALRLHSESRGSNAIVVEAGQQRVLTRLFTRLRAELAVGFENPSAEAEGEDSIFCELTLDNTAMAVGLLRPLTRCAPG
jgi:hypothetical protein